MSDSIPANARGKWSQAGVPHRGWNCIATRDLREEFEDYLTCEMCETQTIRFVHTMEHPDYPTTLDCGCDCAGYMEGSRKRAKVRDADMRRRANRRQKFPERKGWKVSAKGNSHIKVDGYHCIVARRPNGFSVGITPPRAERPTWGRKTYRSLKEAQEGCFDAIDHMRSNRAQV